LCLNFVVVDLTLLLDLQALVDEMCCLFIIIRAASFH
jgi:hypothetical protein